MHEYSSLFIRQRIQIHFEDFSVQDSTCDFSLIGGAIPDYVQFTENDDQTELARWYGYMDASNALSYRNYDSSNATVRFSSDQEDVGKGFNMTWKFGESTENGNCRALLYTSCAYQAENL